MGPPPQITKKIRVQKVKETVTILYKVSPEPRIEI